MGLQKWCVDAGGYARAGLLLGCGIMGLEVCCGVYRRLVLVAAGAEPRASLGFYIGNLTLDPRSDECQPRHNDTRTRCLKPRACDPPESCLGDDLCSEEYLSTPPLFRCATCRDGFYRIAGKCRKCPDNPWYV